MAFAHTIAMARDLLADGRAEDVLRMVEPLITVPADEAPRAEHAFLMALLARVHAVHTGDVERALSVLAPFEEDGARGALPDTVRAQVTLWLGWAHARRDETFDEEARALTLLDEAHQLFDAEADASGRHWAELGRAHAYFRIDEYQLMRAALDEVAPVQRSVRDVQATRWFHDLSVAACRFQGRYDAAQRHIDALAEWATNTANREVQGRARAYQAALYLDLGYAPKRIAQTAEQAVALLRDVTAEVDYPLLAAYHAHVRALLLQGDWSRAERLIASALREVGNRPTSRAHLTTLQARLALRRNRPAAANDIMEQLFAQAHRLPHGLQRSHVALLRGELLAQAGRYEEAYPWLRRAYQNARETGHRGNQLRALLTEARAALDAADSERADELLNAIERYDDYFSVLPFAASRFDLEGRRHAADGRSDEAHAAFQQARSAYTLIGDAYHAALMDRGMAPLESSSQARILLDDAAATLDRLGLNDEAQTARQSLTALPTGSVESVDSRHALSTTLARASASPRLVAEAWIQALEPLLPDGWLGVYRYTKPDGWTCVHEHGVPPSHSYPPCPDQSHEVDGMRWLPLYACDGQHFVTGIDASHIADSDWETIRAQWSAWRPVVQLALDRAVTAPPDEASTSSRSGALLDLDGFVYDSASMRSIVQRIQRTRASHSPVLITGERGVGKTTVARAIHAMSERAGGSWRMMDACQRLSRAAGCAPLRP